MIVAGGIGLFFRQTYTDVSANENMLEQFTVALWDLDLSPTLIDTMRQVLPDSPIIIRAKSDGRTHYTFKNFYQNVIVEEVYQGKDIAVGDQISIMDFSWYVVFDNMSINASFINLMQSNEEYLIFLEKKLDTIHPDDQIYLTNDLIMPPIFNYEDKEHEILSVTDEDLYVPYSSVKYNEFFVSSEEALIELMVLKHELLAQYPR